MEIGWWGGVICAMFFTLVEGPASGCDVNDDHTRLLSCLDVAIGIGNGVERIPPIYDGNEPARFDSVFQIVHERLSASPLCEGNDDPAASRDLGPNEEEEML